MKQITDTKGVKWRVDEVITGDKARKCQIQPGYSQINLSPPDSRGQCHMGISIPDYILPDVLSGAVRMTITR